MCSDALTCSLARSIVNDSEEESPAPRCGSDIHTGSGQQGTKTCVRANLTGTARLRISGCARWTRPLIVYAARSSPAPGPSASVALHWTRSRSFTSLASGSEVHFRCIDILAMFFKGSSAFRIKNLFLTGAASDQ